MGVAEMAIFHLDSTFFSGTRRQQLVMVTSLTESRDMGNKDEMRGKKDGPCHGGTEARKRELLLSRDWEKN